MIEFLHSFCLTGGQWFLLVTCGILVGIAKTGLSGAGMLVVPVLAGIFGGRSSAGLLLPMLCFGDVFGVTYYHRHAEWRYLWRLMPWTLAGIAIGLFTGKVVSDAQFTAILAVTILGGIAIMIWREKHGEDMPVPDYWWFSALTGLTGGFATMIGNAAGPIMALYLLSMRLPKYAYIGTVAWFFFMVNLFKVPLHIFFWGTITTRTFAFNIAMLPAIAAGAFIGIKAVRHIPEKAFRSLMIAMTVLAAVKIFF